MVSIEFGHVYANDPTFEFTDLKAGFQKAKDVYFSTPQAELCLMIDNYSVQPSNEWSTNAYLDRVQAAFQQPELIVYESSLIPVALTVIEGLPKGRVKRELRKYCVRTGKLPCSLFVASWYLYRLGLVKSAPWSFIRFEAKTSAHKLVNVLPEFTKASEKKAMKILNKYGVQDDRIENIYY